MKALTNPIFVLNIISMLWGMNFIMVKIVLLQIHPVLLAFIRIFLVSLIFIFMYCIFGIPKHIKENFNKLFTLSILGIVGNQYCFLIGLSYTQPSHSALSMSFIPIFTHIVAYIFRIEKISKKTVLSLFTGVTGFIIIHNDIQSKIFIGDLLTITGALFFALYMVLFKTYNINMNSFQISSLTYILATPIVFIISIPHLPEVPYVLNIKIIAPLLYIIVFASIITYILHLWAMKKIKVSTVSLFTFLQPIWATIYSFLFFNKTLSSEFFIGGILIVAAIIISEL